jgi:hypothetical protein
LGLVELRNNKYFLTDLGKKYICLPTVDRNSLLTVQLIKLPIIEMVINKAQKSIGRKIDLNEISELI